MNEGNERRGANKKRRGEKRDKRRKKIAYT